MLEINVKILFNENERNPEASNSKFEANLMQISQEFADLSSIQSAETDHSHNCAFSTKDNENQLAMSSSMAPK